jgi:hypothetical protein
MIQLRLTQKVQKSAGVKPSELHEPTESESVFGDWVVNAFNEDRRKHLVFVNERTLYSFVLTCVRKEHYKNIKNSFLAGLIQLLELDGFSLKEIQHLMRGYTEIQFTKTHSRKVLGNVNDLVNHYRYGIYDNGGIANADIGKIIHHVNRMPQRNIDWGFSIKAVADIAKNA